jgi:hypothetical protein
MSYDPSYRMPPRQERWPNATPAEGWPSYRDGDEADRRHGADRRDAHAATAGQRQAGRHGAHAAVATAPFPPAANGYGGANGYGATGTAAYRTGGYPGGGYGATVDGYAGADDGGYAAGTDDSFDGYTRTEASYGQTTTAYAPEYDWAGPEPGYAGGPDDFAGNYLGPGSYIEPGLADPALGADPGLGADTVLSGDPRLTAPDAGMRPDTWLADLEYRRAASWRGPMVGAVTVVLATAVVIGVSTLAAGLLKARISPVSAMGAVFIDRTPGPLRNALLHHVGAQGRTVLLLGMYATFAVVAIVIGALARRSAAVGVAGVAMFALFEAFVVITRPGGQVGDVTPAVIGGIAGVAAAVWLFRASAQTPRAQAPRAQPPLRHPRGGARRRTR